MSECEYFSRLENKIVIVAQTLLFQSDLVTHNDVFNNSSRALSEENFISKQNGEPHSKLQRPAA